MCNSDYAFCRLKEATKIDRREGGAFPSAIFEDAEEEVVGQNVHISAKIRQTKHLYIILYRAVNRYFCN